MIDLILLLQADRDIQSAFQRYENYQAGRGEIFIRQLDFALTLLRQHPEIAPVCGGLSAYARPGFSVRHILSTPTDAIDYRGDHGP